MGAYFAKVECLKFLRLYDPDTDREIRIGPCTPSHFSIHAIDYNNEGEKPEYWENWLSKAKIIEMDSAEFGSLYDLISKINKHKEEEQKDHSSLTKKIEELLKL